MSAPSPPAPRGFKDHFSTGSAAYRAMRPTYPAALFDWLARQAPARAAAWDCGCGSGQATLPLAERFARVYATDPSAAQLAEAPARPNIAYSRGRAEASGLPDRSVDLALAAQAAHWFDQDAFHAELRRVVRPGGVAALVSYGVIEGDDAVGEALAAFYHGPIHSHWPPERAHVEAGYRSLPFPFADIAAPAFEIAVDWPLAHLVGYIGTWSAVQAYRMTHGADPVPDAEARLAAAWGDPTAPRRFRFPLSLRVGRVGTAAG